LKTINSRKSDVSKVDRELKPFVSPGLRGMNRVVARAAWTIFQESKNWPDPRDVFHLLSIWASDDKESYSKKIIVKFNPNDDILFWKSSGKHDNKEYKIENCKRFLIGLRKNYEKFLDKD
jgi:hypothetical protein